MSPAITSPLSSTRSRISTRPWVRVGCTISGILGYWEWVLGVGFWGLGGAIGFAWAEPMFIRRVHAVARRATRRSPSPPNPIPKTRYPIPLSQPTQRTKIDIQVVIRQPNGRFQIAHALVALE